MRRLNDSLHQNCTDLSEYLSVWDVWSDDSFSAASCKPTCFIVVVTDILNSSKNARQTGFANAVLPEKNHFVHLGFRLAAGGDDRVGGIRGAAASVLLAGGVGRAAQEVGQFVRLSRLRCRCAQVPVVHRHASPVQVGEVDWKRDTPSSLVHIPQFVTLIQSHCAKTDDLWIDEPCVNVSDHIHKDTNISLAE